MSVHGLIVEDDSRIIPSIEDVLFSIGHEFDWVTNQHDAQEKLRSGEYDYLLLDLQIPAKANRGGANKQFSVNLLENILNIKGPGRLPVIIMTAFSGECLDLTRTLLSLGACDFIAKPFENSSRPLAQVIRKVLEEHQTKAVPAAAPQERPFTGGELVLRPDRAELCGVKIIADHGAGQSLNLLRSLSQQDSQGRFVRRSAEDLVDSIRALGGVGTITGGVRTIRRNVISRMRKHRGLICESDSLIRNDEQGYYLREWISVPGGRDPWPIEKSRPELPRMNERQEWILSELRRGVKLERVMIERRFGVHARTAKRDLAELNGRGLVEFDGDGYRARDA